MQQEALEGALRQLWVLDALDANGGITPLGRQMVSLPLEPSLARALIAATQLGCLSQATIVAAMLSAESIFQGNRSAISEVLLHEPHALPDRLFFMHSCVVGDCFVRQFASPLKACQLCLHWSARLQYWNAFLTSSIIVTAVLSRSNANVRLLQIW